jgi:hypothetical protein
MVFAVQSDSCVTIVILNIKINKSNTH